MTLPVVRDFRRTGAGHAPLPTLDSTRLLAEAAVACAIRLIDAIEVSSGDDKFELRVALDGNVVK
jgi:hypothetical protein